MSVFLPKKTSKIGGITFSTFSSDMVDIPFKKKTDDSH